MFHLSLHRPAPAKKMATVALRSTFWQISNSFEHVPTFRLHFLQTTAVNIIHLALCQKNYLFKKTSDRLFKRGTFNHESMFRYARNSQNTLLKHWVNQHSDDNNNKTQNAWPKFYHFNSKYTLEIVYLQHQHLNRFGLKIAKCILIIGDQRLR